MCPRSPLLGILVGIPSPFFRIRLRFLNTTTPVVKTTIKLQNSSAFSDVTVDWDLTRADTFLSVVILVAYSSTCHVTIPHKPLITAKSVLCFRLKVVFCPSSDRYSGGLKLHEAPEVQSIGVETKDGTCCLCICSKFGFSDLGLLCFLVSVEYKTWPSTYILLDSLVEILILLMRL